MAEADLLRRLASNNRSDEGPTAAVNDPGELELSLGLSLGGCFGTDPRQKGLVRSSSIASLSFPRREQEGSVEPGLNRACSLPVETEEEQRKRKEFQSLRRMEAKRKRSEKRGFSLVSQGSAGSQGSDSSDISDFDSRSMQGLDISGGGSCRETWSPSSIQPLPDHTNQKGADSPVGSNAGKPTNSAEDSSKKKNRIRRNGMRDMMEEMPCVFTRGNGPNGRRIEGFLYRCRKGEQVRIVCVCHGSFFSPAEFVKHAGGGDVAHPLRHIVVNPSPSTFL